MAACAGQGQLLRDQSRESIVIIRGSPRAMCPVPRLPPRAGRQASVPCHMRLLRVSRQCGRQLYPEQDRKGCVRSAISGRPTLLSTECIEDTGQPLLTRGGAQGPPSLGYFNSDVIKGAFQDPVSHIEKPQTPPLRFPEGGASEHRWRDLRGTEGMGLPVPPPPLSPDSSAGEQRPPQRRCGEISARGMKQKQKGNIPALGEPLRGGLQWRQMLWGPLCWRRRQCPRGPQHTGLGEDTHPLQMDWGGGADAALGSQRQQESREGPRLWAGLRSQLSADRPWGLRAWCSPGCLRLFCNCFRGPWEGWRPCLLTCQECF